MFEYNTLQAMAECCAPVRKIVDVLFFFHPLNRKCLRLVCRAWKMIH